MTEKMTTEAERDRLEHRIDWMHEQIRFRDERIEELEAELVDTNQANWSRLIQAEASRDRYHAALEQRPQLKLGDRSEYHDWDKVVRAALK